MKRPSWNQIYGPQRRAKDRAYLEAAERALEAEERKIDQAKWLETEMRQQLAFEAEKRESLAQLTK
jgi:hypothetical protein